MSTYVGKSFTLRNGCTIQLCIGGSNNSSYFARIKDPSNHVLYTSDLGSSYSRVRDICNDMYKRFKDVSAYDVVTTIGNQHHDPIRTDADVERSNGILQKGDLKGWQSQENIYSRDRNTGLTGEEEWELWKLRHGWR